MLTLKSTDLGWRTPKHNFYGLSAFLEKSSVLAILSSLVVLTWICKDIPHSTTCGNLNFSDSWQFALLSLELLKLQKKEKLIGREKFCQSFKLFDSPMMFALDQLAMEPASLRKIFQKIRFFAKCNLLL